MTRAITLTPAEALAAQAGTLKEIRRVVRPPDPDIGIAAIIHQETTMPGVWCAYSTVLEPQLFRCPYQPGTELWGRETFALEREFTEHNPYDPPHNDGRPVQWRYSDDYGRYWVQPHYKATDPSPDLGEEGTPRWRSPATMPRWASRWSGVVESVRLERDGDVWVWVYGLKRS